MKSLSKLLSATAGASLFLVAAVAQADTQSYGPGYYTYQIPDGVTQVSIEVMGGGGGGGASCYGPGGMGGQPSYNGGTFAVSAGEVLTIEVGGGGPGGCGGGGGGGGGGASVEGPGVDIAINGGNGGNGTGGGCAACGGSGGNGGAWISY